MPDPANREQLSDHSALRVVGVRASAVPCDECRDEIARLRGEFIPALPTESALHIAVGVMGGGWACDHVEYDQLDVSEAFQALYRWEMRWRDRLRAENERLTSEHKARGEAIVRLEIETEEIDRLRAERDANAAECRRLVVKYADRAPLVAELERLRKVLDDFDRYASVPGEGEYNGSPFQAEVRSALQIDEGQAS